MYLIFNLSLTSRNFTNVLFKILEHFINLSGYVLKSNCVAKYMYLE